MLLLAAMPIAPSAYAAEGAKPAAAARPASMPPRPTAAKAGTEPDRWSALQRERAPGHIVARVKAFKRDFPRSAKLKEAGELEANASRVLAIHHAAGLTTEFFETVRGNSAFETSLLGAARGDADAAFAVASAFLQGKSGPAADARRYEQWLRIASELGHARASWDLAQVLNRAGLVADAGHYEQRAVVFGYRPPPRLSNRDY